ncbi:MAG: non-canonical purine NTP pyrophosphatase, partial [Actinobacteria bacterium]|nr:non-canonical purine NTP pyrophosphatase [Actinomycetota bacterium]
MPELLVASRNAKKLAELQRVLDAAGVVGLTLLSLADVPEYPEAPETGATFEENALAKARDGFEATGIPCIADDSGVSVDALNGMPGVLSARWAGGHGDDRANLELVLGELEDVPDDRRGAA